MSFRAHRGPSGSVRTLLSSTLSLTAFFILPFAASGEDAAAPPPPDGPPSILARSAIMIDAATQDVLYEKDADIPIPPASLTKLMTIHLAYDAIAEGRYSLDDYIPILKEDCYPELPYRSSLMFLGGGMRVTLGELLVGLAIPSGNDAAFAVARALSGSIEDFAEDMNAEARSMGLSKTRFVEPSGLSERNMTTAREFAEFCRQYVQLHPEALRDLHSRWSLSFPLLKNMQPGYTGPERPVYQENRNTLVRDYPGCDGLKTGYIDESGYNIALTAHRSGTRLIAVILGGYGVSTAEGSKTRADNGSRLLDYGFNSFVTVRPDIGALPSVRVWKGKTSFVTATLKAEAAATVHKADESRLRFFVQADEDVIAPVIAGQALGEVVFSIDGRVIKRIPLVSASDVPRGNIFKRAWHSIILFFRGRRG